jgi:hypothetical protein
MSVKSDGPSIADTAEAMGSATQHDLTDKVDNRGGHAIRNTQCGRNSASAHSASLAFAGFVNNRVLHCDCGAAL